MGAFSFGVFRKLLESDAWGLRVDPQAVSEPPALAGKSWSCFSCPQTSRKALLESAGPPKRPQGSLGSSGWGLLGVLGVIRTRDFRFGIAVAGSSCWVHRQVSGVEFRGSCSCLPRCRPLKIGLPRSGGLDFEDAGTKLPSIYVVYASGFSIPLCHFLSVDPSRLARALLCAGDSAGAKGKSSKSKARLIKGCALCRFCIYIYIYICIYIHVYI